jgi:hypothetical protein
MGAKNFIFIFTNLAIKGKKEKIKQGREDFFFYPVRNNAPLLCSGVFRIIPGSAP